MKESFTVIKESSRRIGLMRLCSFAIAFLFLVATQWANGQGNSTTVSGFVYSKSSPDGIPGVSIAIKGANKGVITDASGKFTLEVSSEDVLVFSFVGLAKQEIKVGDQTLLL